VATIEASGEPLAYPENQSVSFAPVVHHAFDFATGARRNPAAISTISKAAGGCLNGGQLGFRKAIKQRAAYGIT
jgi:hypothetical protein